MTLALLNYPLFRAWDANGLPLAGGKLYSYIAGTSTPLALVASDGVTPLSNPVILNSQGQADIRLQARAYKLLLTDASDVTMSGWPVDNVNMTLANGINVVTTTINSSAGAAILTATNLIPAGARVMTVSTKILTGFGASGGLASFAVGDSASMDRWGVSAALTTNSLTGCSDAPAAAQQRDSSIPLYTAAESVIISALGGLFDSTGQLQVAVQYFTTPYRIA